MIDTFDDDESSAKQPSEFAQMFEASLQNKKSKRFQVGDKVKGEILVLGKEEVFVSIGPNKDGVVPRRELQGTDGKFDQIKVGDVMDLFVTAVKGSEVFLSPKPTAKNLADDLEDAFDMMLPVEGRVTEVCKGGVRVNIRGKSAFCPISQLDLKRVETGEEYVGQKLEFRITQFSEGGRNIVVSRRKLLEEQRGLIEATFAEEKKPGERLTGTVTRLELFGAFVEVAPGIEGLAHISELSWSRVAHPSEVLSVGQIVDAKLLEVTRKEGRLKISLSIKQASGENPREDGAWQTRVGQKFPVGTILSGRIERKEPYGIFVKLEDGVVGLLPKSKALDHPEFHFEKLRVGDQVSVQVAELRLEERRISLEVPRDPESDDWKGHASVNSGGGGFATLGDQLRKALAPKASDKKRR
jgi:small subunit ribosomal protein S1